MKFYIVDVFPKKKFSGNQVAIVEQDLELSDKKMQKIAREMNFTETVFITYGKLENGGYNVRIFTPDKEVEFSGHALIGCAYIILKYYSEDDIMEGVIFNLPNDNIHIHVQYENLVAQKKYAFWIHEREPRFGYEFEKILLSRVLSIEPENIDGDFPIIEVDTGLPMIIVPIKDLAGLKEIKINKKRYNWLIARTEAKAILTFTRETYDAQNDVNVRVFGDYFGIPEDPATGSGNGGLVAYLSKYSYFPDKPQDLSIKIEQGFEINRPSIIYARCEQKEDKFNVLIGGNVILVAEGNFKL